MSHPGSEGWDDWKAAHNKAVLAGMTDIERIDAYYEYCRLHLEHLEDLMPGYLERLRDKGDNDDIK